MISDRIKSARAAAKISQSALAKIIGTTQCQIARYELGEQIPGGQRLRDLAKALKVKTGDLLDDPDPPPDGTLPGCLPPSINFAGAIVTWCEKAVREVREVRAVSNVREVRAEYSKRVREQRKRSKSGNALFNCFHSIVTRTVLQSQFITLFTSSIWQKHYHKR